MARSIPIRSTISSSDMFLILTDSETVSYRPSTCLASVVQLTRISTCFSRLWNPSPNMRQTRARSKAEWMMSSTRLTTSSEWSMSSYIHSDNTTMVMGLSTTSSTRRPLGEQRWKLGPCPRALCNRGRRDPHRTRTQTSRRRGTLKPGQQGWRVHEEILQMKMGDQNVFTTPQ